MSKLLVILAALAGLLGLTVVLAQTAPLTPPQDDSAPPSREARRPLHTDAIAVRLLLGVGDTEQRPWNGRVALDAGEVVSVEPYRFRAGDRVVGPDGWEARSLVLRRTTDPKAKVAAKKKAGQARGKNQGKAAAKKVAGTGPLIGPTGVVVALRAAPSATLTVTTEQGQAAIPLADLAPGAAKRYLNGAIEAQSVPAHAPLATSAGQEDFPAAAPDGAKGAWVAYIDHQSRGPEASAQLKEEPVDFKSFIPAGGGDQVKLLHFDGQQVVGEWDVTEPGRDVYRPAVALGAGGKVVVVWPENVDGNWDLHLRTFDPASNAWAEPRRITTQPGSDADPVLATDESGGLWLAWQAWVDGQADIWLTSASAPDLGEPGKAVVPIAVTSTPANEWAPSIAVGRDGVHVAFDTYESGSYDVKLATIGAASAPKLLKIVPIAATNRFEARPSLAIDAKGRAWIAYEERTENWGKDFGVHDRTGTPLYQASTVRVRVVDGNQVLDAGEPAAAAPTDPERRMNSFPRLALDESGRPLLLYRHRAENNWRDSPVPIVGALWYEYVTARSGENWTPPRPVPRSDNLLDNRPALVRTTGGPVLAFYSSDGRLHGEAARQAQGGAAAKKAGRPPAIVNNDLFVAALRAPEGLPDPAAGSPAPDAAEPPSSIHPTEAEDVARLRAHRIEAGGKTYQLMRGEFHRHTEISPDGGGDGALEDMWRYGLDVGRLDWIGCGDHDNGSGREYTWWLTQKTTDLYHNPPAFVPMFTYERSVNYPGGHRNVMFPRRGIRTLPRLTGDNGVQTDINGRDLDAAMLYRYLNELGGICASHTSGTDMGTDWRANDPKAEPFVEIYQGDRDSYEYFGAPRVAHNPKDAAGGWRPLGMVWNALAMQYRLGFQSSSDHISTHISFAVAIAESPTREALFDAFRRRHCYAATDNILLDVRSGPHLMGDEFTTDGPVTLRVKVHGTAPIAKIDIIKDFHHVYTTEPKQPEVAFEWTDEDPVNRNPSWYYVRVLQTDGEIAWGSPMWISR